MTRLHAHLHPETRGVRRVTHVRGFTLLELMIGVAIVGLLAAAAIPSYSEMLERQKVGQSVRDLVQIAGRLQKYYTIHFALPESLSDIGMQDMKDPWGANYEYLNFASKSPGVKGRIRKDHNLHPLNTDFDLYSKGADGKSVSPLTARASQDDIIWGRDGGFVGIAKDF